MCSSSDLPYYAFGAGRGGELDRFYFEVRTLPSNLLSHLSLFEVRKRHKTSLVNGVSRDMPRDYIGHGIRKRLLRDLTYDCACAAADCCSSSYPCFLSALVIPKGRHSAPVS